MACALVLGPQIPASPVAAEIPEMGACFADAELIVGSVGGSVTCVQWTLMWKGFYRGLVNGIYDQATFQAVVEFQQANPPLTVNGNSGERTLAAMGIYSGVDQAPPPACLADAPVASGDRGPSTECLQQVLQTKGVFTGTVDGSFGKSTQAAVKSYQLSNPPLVADGVADTQTLAALGIWSGFSTAQSNPVSNGDDWWPASIQAEPNFRASNGIPVFGNHRFCTRENADIIAREFAKDGADVATQHYFIYIASREGGCDHRAVNQNAVTRRQPLHVPAERVVGHVRAQRSTRSPRMERRQREGQHVELRRRGERPVGVLRAWSWTPPYSCAPPWAGDLGPEGDA